MKDDLEAFQKEAQRVQSLDPVILENQKRRVQSLLKLPEGREALRRELGYDFLFADDALKDGRPLVSLLVPTRSGPKPETSKAVDAMMRASRPHCILTPEPGISQSVVHWSRNDLILKLRKSGRPADYVLFMDDDMTPPPDALVKLLAHDQDIVAGACTVRTDPPLPNFRIWMPDVLSFRTAFEWTDQNGMRMGEGLVEVGGVGAAFMLITTSALDKIGEYYLSCQFERKYMGMSDEVARDLEAGRRRYAKETGNEFWFEFLKHPLGDGEFGEDLSFCFKARECGYKIYVDTSVCPGHIGSYAYGIPDFLSYQCELLAREAVKEEVAP
jgi:hypothetical protein